ncbi:MAG: hypothetical protein LC105_05460 [Chitinophagales bacterium]|nr:hypothetical protein [Chitinophagales bacterium]
MIKIDTSFYSSLSISQLRRIARDEYNLFVKGKTVKNKDLNIEINLTNIGGRKTSYGGLIYPKKVALIKYIPTILNTAKYSNFGNRKKIDKEYVVGYLNFKSPIEIDSKKEYLHIVIQMRKDGKFYYSIDVNKLLNKKGNEF